MTAPVTTDALVEALAYEMARLDGWQDPNALWTDNLGIIARGGEGSPVYLDYVEDARALVAGPLAPLLAAHQQVTAERDEEKARADWLAGIIIRVLRKLSTPTEKSAAEDFWLGYLDGERLRQREIESALVDELARLRVEVELLCRVARPFVAKSITFQDGRTGLSEGPKVSGADVISAYEVIAAALARAATAREGQADDA